MVFEWYCELRLTAHRSGACGTDSDGVHECGHYGLPDLQPLGQQLGDQAVDVRPKQIPQLPARHSHSLERLHTDTSTQCNTMVDCNIFWHAGDLALVPYTYTSLWLSTHAVHTQLSPRLHQGTLTVDTALVSSKARCMRAACPSES